MAQTLTILGAGSWGTALAVALAPRFEHIYLWAHDPALSERLQCTRVNDVYLPPARLPVNVTVSSTPTASPWILSVIPSKHLRPTITGLAPHFPSGARWISATKGIEANTFLRMTEVIASIVPNAPPGAALSGPTFAKEVALGEPAAMVIASNDEVFAKQLQAAFTGGNLRLYTNRDIAGVEYASALKNVIAIAAGAVEGLGLGSNSTAAVITRGLAEIGRLVMALGGRAETVSGLAGLGDLVLTCTGALSRNRRVGIELAKGRPLADILNETRMVAEGVETTATALKLAAIHGIDMPLSQSVAAMLQGKPAREVLRQLVDRAPKSED
jgi:glycerol-3-phosphate dehydrogenase (NAD(P)+)